MEGAPIDKKMAPRWILPRRRLDQEAYAIWLVDDSMVSEQVVQATVTLLHNVETFGNGKSMGEAKQEIIHLGHVLDLRANVARDPVENRASLGKVINFLSGNKGNLRLLEGLAGKFLDVV